MNTLTTSLKRILFILIVSSLAFASGTKAQDTVSTDGIEFTDIPTAADSLAAAKAKQKQDTLKKAETAKTTVAAPKDAQKTLWQIFIAGFLGGLIAVTMPCIYPMLPLTVSFFTKKAGSRAKGITQSMIYGLSIIVIYVLLGMVVTLGFGPGALNALSTNGIFNIFFFLMLVVFGISFLGAFEITLPSSLANKLDENSNKGGLTGIFFMAATLVVVSFSCTGPIIGTLLVDAASKGARLGPAIGMFGFSLALALPFTLFALFPSTLKSLPKSGGWLNSIKVVLGFLELAFALKFLSNVDLAYHWDWFDREVFLSLWIAIFLLMGLYLIGKIKFSHDSDLAFLSVPRTMFATIVFAFVAYMIPGLWGAPLKSISAFLPPPATQDFYLSDNAGEAAPITTQKVSVGEKKYADLFKRGRIKGINSWYDYEQALLVSKQLKKPIIIDFTGWNCVNCRKMENDVWEDPAVFKRLRDEYVLLQLYVDEKTALKPNEVYISDFSGKKITTLGAKWLDLEGKRFGANAQPYYVLLDSDGNLMNDANGQQIQPSGANFNIDSYINFLDSGIAAYKNKK
ncbi:thioredoxin family protein [Mucilaginibacter sp. UR6-1]|uniref:protein-disulfide reductase DsbD family protein n=1 Tax=Mucilaginibacter sp. UR6-1 TaxID=1435643 RepID=UPI001E2D48F3|nr:cytochrome c biogenesis protein CcdA [Mucilaginibacter sp. UR6-1]MCC8411040.1 thioredoxin family protein [Mucilaginibacter sp. UR6-1]